MEDSFQRVWIGIGGAKPAKMAANHSNARAPQQRNFGLLAFTAGGNPAARGVIFCAFDY